MKKTNIAAINNNIGKLLSGEKVYSKKLDKIFVLADDGKTILALGEEWHTGCINFYEYGTIVNGIAYKF